jgi:putative transposase
VDRRIWQTRFYDHVVRDEEDWRTRLNYMHDNPVRAGLVGSPTDHTWSSAMFWETGTGPVACDGTMW